MKEDCLLGVITYEDVLDAMEDIADETMRGYGGYGGESERA